jgi:hypothetical protein
MLAVTMLIVTSATSSIGAAKTKSPTYLTSMVIECKKVNDISSFTYKVLNHQANYVKSNGDIGLPLNERAYFVIEPNCPIQYNQTFKWYSTSTSANWLRLRHQGSKLSHRSCNKSWPTCKGYKKLYQSYRSQRVC